MSLPKNFDPGKSNSVRRSNRSPNIHSDKRSVLHPNACDRPSTTHCALLTGVGKSAIAVIALRGTQAAEIVAACFQSATKGRFSPGQIRYGVWAGPNRTSTDRESVVVTPVDANHFEIHCHGGSAATTRIVDDLCSCGATRVQPQTLSTTKNLLITESYQVLAHCLTARTAAIAMDQARGALSNWVESQLEKVDGRSVIAADLRRQVDKLLRDAEFGTRLGTQFRVVLVGPPNVGKSSLLNAILGYDRSITFDAAGTTRDVLHATTVLDGLPIRLSDTAGIRETEEPLERQGVARARTAADDADLVLALSAPPAGLGGGLRGRSGVQRPEVFNPNHRLIRVLNKSDLVDDPATTGQPWDVATSARTGEGVAKLMELIANRLCESMPKPGSPVPITDRQANLLREIRAAESSQTVLIKLRELLGVNI